MFITIVVKLWTLLKIVLFMFFLILTIKYLYKLKKLRLKRKKDINYLLKRNTKSFFKNRYDMNILHKKSEDAKVYNINCDDDVIKYDNGDIYKGQIKNGIREGLGTCYFANKDIYEGMWKNDRMDCVGKYIYADKSYYSGDFKNGCKEGIGVYQCDDYKYIGQYYANRKGRVGTFHLMENDYLKVIIENGTIVEGTYLREGCKEEYIYNVDLSNEREVIKNIKSYFTREVSNI
ncbi:hypothetical protein [Terrisporobacter sp.]